MAAITLLHNNSQFLIIAEYFFHTLLMFIDIIIIRLSFIFDATYIAFLHYYCHCFSSFIELPENIIDIVITNTHTFDSHKIDIHIHITAIDWSLIDYTHILDYCIACLLHIDHTI